MAAQIPRSGGSDAGWHHAVPRINEFYGIVIWLYRDDHPPAHFHAQYGEHWGLTPSCSLWTVALSVLNSRRRFWTALGRSEAAWHSEPTDFDWCRPNASPKY